VVLHAPPWVLMDEVLDALDEDARQGILDLFLKDLRHTGVIHIGRADAHDHFFSRVLNLVKDPALRRLTHGKVADSATARPSTSTA
jgi:putative ATP-binding cassette transporter